MDAQLLSHLQSTSVCLSGCLEPSALVPHPSVSEASNKRVGGTLVPPSLNEGKPTAVRASSSIRHLGFLVRPAKVAWFVVAVVVDAIQRLAGWLLSQVGKHPFSEESMSFQLEPLSALIQPLWMNFDAPSPVISKAFVLGVQAPLFDSCQRHRQVMTMMSHSFISPELFRGTH